MDARALCLLALVPLLAGCVGTSCDPQPPVSARGVGPGTPSAGGDGGYSATLTVTQEPGGPGLAGAGVVFFWGREDSGAALRGERPVVHVGAQGGDGSASIDIGTGLPAPPAYTATLPLRAGPDGTVTARLPTDRIVGVVAAADGWTEEWIPALATGHAGTLQLRLPLYHEHLALDLPGTLGPGSASTAILTGEGSAAWSPQDARLGATPEATRGYLARLTGLEAWLNWTNGPLAFGDLALAVGPDGSTPTQVRDSGADAAMGERTQQLQVQASDVRDRGLQGAGHLYIGPATRTAYFGPTGLAYTLHVDLTMDRAQAFQQSCGGVTVSAEAHPSPAAGALVVVGLLGAALLARRG
jgi:hypothetical protein